MRRGVVSRMVRSGQHTLVYVQRGLERDRAALGKLHPNSTGEDKAPHQCPLYIHLKKKGICASLPSLQPFFRSGKSKRATHATNMSAPNKRNTGNQVAWAVGSCKGAGAASRYHHALRCTTHSSYLAHTIKRSSLSPRGLLRHAGNHAQAHARSITHSSKTRKEERQRVLLVVLL